MDPVSITPAIDRNRADESLEVWERPSMGINHRMDCLGGNVDEATTIAIEASAPAPETPVGSLLRADSVVIEINDKRILDKVSLDLQPGTFTGIVGGSGAGKSTLIKAITGQLELSGGSVTLGGLPAKAYGPNISAHIGVVPQDDVLHTDLTVQQVLDYTAGWRLALPADRRAEVIEKALTDMQLLPQRRQRVSTLSGGQRKRVSVAVELLADPEILILDEPTSGLDPLLDRSTMLMLRSLADDGRTVVVVTHNVGNLGLVDQVLLLAGGGRTAYLGSPEGLVDTFGTGDFAEALALIAEGNDERNDADDGSPVDLLNATQAERFEPVAVTHAFAAVRNGRLQRPSGVIQTWVVLRRQVRLVWSNRAFRTASILLPVVLASLIFVVPGENGLSLGADKTISQEAARLLLVGVLGAVLMGTAASIRTFVDEREIHDREAYAGLRSGSYFTGKVLALSALVTVQSLVLVALTLAFREGPRDGFLGGPGVDLALITAGVAVASMAIGMLLSALSPSRELAMPLFVLVVMIQIVLNGSMIPITGRPVIEQASWFIPARWGIAAGSGLIGNPGPTPSEPDALWISSVATMATALWALTLIVLVSLLVALAIVARRTPLAHHKGSLAPVAITIAALLALALAGHTLSSRTVEAAPLPEELVAEAEDAAEDALATAEQVRDEAADTAEESGEAVSGATVRAADAESSAAAAESRAAAAESRADAAEAEAAEMRSLIEYYEGLGDSYCEGGSDPYDEGESDPYYEEDY